MGIHRVWDFTDELQGLTEAERADVSEAQPTTVTTLQGIITAVGPDSFTLRADDGSVSTWPLRGALREYRRGSRCHLLLGDGELVGVGELDCLRYVSLPELAGVWVESRGLTSAAQ